MIPGDLTQGTNVDNSPDFIANAIKQANHSNLLISTDKAYRIEPRFSHVSNVDNYTISPNGKSVVLLSSKKIGIGSPYDGAPASNIVSITFSNSSGVDLKVAWSKAYSSSTTSSPITDYIVNGCWLSDTTYSFIQNTEQQAWGPNLLKGRDLVMLDTSSGRINSWSIPNNCEISFFQSINKAVVITKKSENSTVQILDKSGLGANINAPKDAIALGVDQQKAIYIQAMGSEGTTYHVLSSNEAGFFKVGERPELIAEQTTIPVTKLENLELSSGTNAKLSIQVSNPDPEMAKYGLNRFALLDGPQAGFLSPFKIENRSAISVWNYDPQKRIFSVNLLFTGSAEGVKSAIKTDIQSAQRKDFAQRIQDYLSGFYEAHQRNPSVDEFYRRFSKEVGLNYSPTATENGTNANYFEWFISPSIIWRKVG